VCARNSWHALQRRTRENSATEFCERSTPEADLYRAVTGEESWVIIHNREAKRWSPERCTRRPPLKQNRGSSKVSINSCWSLLFFRDLFVVKQEFVPVGQTVNSAFDIKVPKHLTAKKKI